MGGVAAGWGGVGGDETSSHLPAYLEAAQSDWRLSQLRHWLLNFGAGGSWGQELPTNSCPHSAFLTLHRGVGPLGYVTSFGIDCDVTCKLGAPPRCVSGPI